MIRKRISLVSYNLWNTERWPEREPALAEFLTTFNPDILCVQELRSETRQCILQNLGSHDCIDDEAPGWVCEGNIFWNRNYFSLLEHGLEDIETCEPQRGFFWVRLKHRDSDATLFVSTAHFTWQGHEQELATGFSPRFRQTHKTIEFLHDLVNENEPAFFMGDLNDPFIPNHFFPQAGYHSCFKKLGVLSPPTCPSVPTTDWVQDNQTIDWIFSNDRASAISAAVPQFYHRGISPSDHWPVHAIYQL